MLAYLSVGTVEKWRGWYSRLKPYRLKAWRDWKDEWYADTSKAGYRDELVAIAGDEILDKGFDGLFLDNTDMVESRSHRTQRQGMGELVADLDELVDADGRLLFTQNGAPGMLEGYGDAVDPLSRHFDGWNREDVTWTYDFDRRTYVRNRSGDRSQALDELDEIGSAGLVTTATDYVDLGDGSTDAECESLANAHGRGRARLRRRHRPDQAAPWRPTPRTAERRGAWPRPYTSVSAEIAPGPQDLDARRRRRAPGVANRRARQRALAIGVVAAEPG